MAGYSSARTYTRARSRRRPEGNGVIDAAKATIKSDLWCLRSAPRLVGRDGARHWLVVPAPLATRVREAVAGLTSGPGVGGYAARRTGDASGADGARASGSVLGHVNLRLALVGGTPRTASTRRNFAHPNVFASNTGGAENAHPNQHRDSLANPVRESEPISGAIHSKVMDYPAECHWLAQREKLGSLQKCRS